MSDYEKLSKGLLTGEDIERLVDECIPMETCNPVISTFGSITIDDLNKVIEQMKRKKTYTELVQENEQLKKENQMLKLTVEKLTKTPYEYSVRGN